MEPRHIRHLFWRAGFGITPAELEKIKHKSRAEIVDDLFYDAKSFRKVEVNHDEFKNLYPKDVLKRKGELMRIIAELRTKMHELNIAWFERLAEHEGVLREKMTLFWANHFACRDNHSYFMQNLINSLREGSLGNFRKLTKSISREAAMIRFLNLKQNRRLHPNENFARELMELFTLGPGNYTESDIKESARAFTGYSHGFFGNFLFQQKQHDFGRKEFLGRRGYFKGDDIIDIILLERKCARFICEKIYRYFVNPTINEVNLEKMISVFYPRYDIEELMRFVFNSDWFYKTENIGVKIKSPIEFLVGMYYTVPIDFKKKKQLMPIQNTLGQMLLYPPNVAGWPSDKKWIDSNTMLLRLRFASILLNNLEIPSLQKNGFNDTFKKSTIRKKKNRFEVTANWKHFENSFATLDIEELPQFLLQADLSEGAKDYIDSLARTSKSSYCVQLMSTPEYQMC